MYKRQSIFNGTEEFENDLYNTFEEETKKILNKFDDILDENNKTVRSEDKIIDMYLDAQKGICTTYFNKIYSRMNTLQEVEENTHKLNEYKNRKNRNQ
mgnify:CR=1 FL=1